LQVLRAWALQRQHGVT